ncbi:hypothetical protein EYF80_061789 [Liparis tanakae]|uniref:Uncharacterized protein n=1 Tax=Liparis tanakae TaxID=230148 RepID=A0A4Z2EH01_9TELE|nr:hypothetical protein EYF80_061789 [Liparis tanakae]
MGRVKRVKRVKRRRPVVALRCRLTETDPPDGTRYSDSEATDAAPRVPSRINVKVRVSDSETQAPGFRGETAIRRCCRQLELLVDGEATSAAARLRPPDRFPPEQREPKGARLPGTQSLIKGSPLSSDQSLERNAT